MRTPIKRLIITFSIATIAAACTKTQTAAGCPQPYQDKLQVASTPLCVQIVSSIADEATGLGGRDSMSADQGMLFKFTAKDPKPGFWMKDMRFDLDLIWINNGRIIGITKNVPAPKDPQHNQEDQLTNYFPPSAVNEVLE